jgi:hypothetical protein
MTVLVSFVDCTARPWGDLVRRDGLGPETLGIHKGGGPGGLREQHAGDVAAGCRGLHSAGSHEAVGEVRLQRSLEGPEHGFSSTTGTDAISGRSGTPVCSGV